MPRGREGFTLAEAAITIVLVGLALSTTLQILQGSRFTAAHTRDLKVAVDLGLRTLAEIESGLWWEEIETTRSGSYAEQDQPDFFFDLAIADETFPEEDYYDDRERAFDNWAYRRELEEDRRTDDDEEQETTEPFEKVRVRVTFPRYGDLPNEVILERWIPWEQVYGPEEEEETGGQGAGGPGGGGASGAGGDDG